MPAPSKSRLSDSNPFRGSDEVEKDPFIQVIFATIMSMSSVMEMYLAIYPNYEDIQVMGFDGDGLFFIKA